MLLGARADVAVASEGGAEDYVEGYARAMAGDTKGGVETLRAFLRDNPGSPLADDAQYAIGEAYYRAHDFAKAIRELQKVEKLYPKGDRVPTALLRESFAYADLGDRAGARRILRRLVSEHGSSPEAGLGRRRLEALGD
jgi:TolA-binding protein